MSSDVALAKIEGLTAVLGDADPFRFDSSQLNNNYEYDKLVIRFSRMGHVKTIPLLALLEKCNKR